MPSVIALWAVIVATPPAGAAQTLARSLIPGVDGLPWGSAREEVVERFGFPARWTVIDSGFALTYRVEVADRAASVTFFVAGAGGLVGASYSVPFAADESCEAVFGELSDLVNSRHPGITPEYNRLDSGSPDPCESATSGTINEPVSWKTPTTILGEMNREMEWRDPNSRASVVLRLGESALELVYLADRSVGVPR